MKKHLLALASAALATSAMMAQEAPEPMELENTPVHAISSNGRYVAGTIEGYGVIFADLETFDGLEITDPDWAEAFTLGSGTNPISDNGIVLICTSYAGTAAYVEDMELKFLPIPDGITSAFCNAITPDGSRIAGTIGIEMTLNASEVMQHPVVWDRQADGTYGMPTILPYPTKDFTGRTPQYVLCAGISADGKTVACQVIDYFGGMSQLLVEKEDAEGEWAYTMVGEDLVNPEGIEFPEYPGDELDPTKYMTAEEIAAYKAAVERAETLEEPDPFDYMTDEEIEAYQEALDSYGWAYPGDFMSEEQAAAYDEAVNQYWADRYPTYMSFMTDEEIERYEADQEEFWDKFGEFQARYEEVMETGTSFDMNQFMISANGRYYAVAGSKGDFWSMETKPYVFDLLNDSYTAFEKNGIALLSPTAVNNEGGILAFKQMDMMDYSTGAFVAATADAELVSLPEYVASVNEEVYDWMKDYMYKYYWTWDDELEEDVEVEGWFTGMTCATPDFSVMVSCVDNTWDYSTYWNSYYLPVKKASGVAAPAANVKEDAPAEYFNLQGIRVDEPLPGLYIRRQGNTAEKVVIK